MDTIRLVARERHFYTADVRLAEYGQVLLIGDQTAVERILTVLSEHEGHEFAVPPSNEDPAP